jgi:hypothetical protein
MRIDVQAHYWTEDYLDLLVDLGKADAGAVAASRPTAASWRLGCG